MTALNLTPLLDSLTGAGTAAAASFRAVAMRAGRGAVRVTGPTVTFPTEITAAWTPTGWDSPPALYTLPADCYWAIRVASAGSRLEGAYILPSDSDAVDFGDLIPVSPTTGTADTSTLAQWLAVQQYVANQAARIDGVAATIFSTVGTVQAQIDTAATVTAQAAAAAAAAAAEQATLAAALADVTTNTQTAADAATQAAADRAAADADAASTAADRAAIDTALGSGGVVGTVQAQIDAAVNALVNGAPGALNDLNELAAALGDDANFAATVTNALASKANLAALAAVALSGSYTDLSNKPPIPSIIDLGNGLLDYTGAVVVNSDGSYGTGSGILATAAGVTATYQTLAQGLLAWTLAQSFTVTSATRDANEAITTAAIVWPDGATGTFTTDVASSVFPGAIDAYHVTHVLGGVTKTVTQPVVTRDAGGAVTAQPALTVA